MRVPPDVLRRCWFLAGATACGKTAAAIELARRLNAEVLSLDSMAIYRGMDIGTAKPTSDEQAAVPHHLIDLVDPCVDFSVAEYVTASQRTCEDILSRGKVPLFVGGTGLYLRSLLRGVFEGPSADLAIRARLEQFIQQHSPEALHARLSEVDQASAKRLHPQDVRRVIRALEIFELTGVAASSQLAEGPLPEGERPRRVFWLAPPRAWLHERINRRVDRMFEAGLVDEVRRLVERPGGLGRTSSQALGYKEVVEYLDGRLTRAECIVQVKTRTRQFAKRQETWFRNLIEARPVEITGRESSAELAGRILELGLAE
ncbi:IPP transferase [Caulifigura coniformis]|uniref:tRNA dimethylallyltransferase n=1 Tax=Caulifigura coniformis TaxID=2527983 RepID=A0A517SAP8_9PLAN|nr:tRNA (adenosine(37)-N6)-dimethylallyltransferase MiaA [Caulifigura coniformis]QDT53156.1 IPP transferase [Caulifigura coniformis]